MAKNIYTSYDFNGNQIKGVADGVLANDVASKGQVDAGVVEAKAYTDSKIEGLGTYVGQLDPTGGLPTVGSGEAGAIDKGDWWYINQTGTLLGVEVHKGDRLQASINNPNTTDNTVANTDFIILETFHYSAIRYEVTNLTLTAGVPVDIIHNLGEKYVHVTLVDSLDDNRIDLDVNYVDDNTVKVLSNVTATVNGVITI